MTVEDWEGLPKLSLREADMKSNTKNDFLHLGANVRQSAQQLLVPTGNVESLAPTNVIKGASARIRKKKV